MTVLLADGPMMAIIPAFVGLSLDAAGAALQQQGMKLRKVIYVPSGEANRVLAQVPESGENILDPDGSCSSSAQRASASMLCRRSPPATTRLL